MIANRHTSLTATSAAIVLLFTPGLSVSAAPIVWANTAGGNWSAATNWVPNIVPGPSDTALITTPGVYTVTLDVSPTIGGLTLGGASGTQTLSMNGQSLSLNGPFTVNANGAYKLDSGALVGNTNAVLTGAFAWAAGSLGGVLTLAPGGSLTINSQTNHDLYNCTVTNDGTVTWASGTLRGGGAPAGTRIYNYGLWNATSDQTFNAFFDGGDAVFNNYSTFRKSAGTNTSQTLFGVGVLFNQLSGLVDVQQGNLVLQGDGNFSAGSVNGPGITYFSSGNFNINGTLTPAPSNFVENGGSLVGNNIINGGLTWGTGNWDGANVTVTSNSTLLVAGGGGSNDLSNCNFTNYGTVTWASETLRGGGAPAGTRVYNYGLWNATSDQTFNGAFGGADTVFNNYSTFRKSVGTNTSQTLFGVGVLFNQLSGLVDVQQGNLVLQGDGNFSAGWVNGPGMTQLSSGNFNIYGTVTPPPSNFVENGGSLVGNNIINGGLTWGAGNWDGANVTVTSNSTLLVMGGSGSNDLSNCNFTNYGTVTWASGTLRGGGAPAGTRVYNYGLWNALSDQTFNAFFGGGDVVFNNYSTFRKSAGTNTGQTLFGAGVTLNNTGTMDAQSGVIAIAGSYNLANGTQISFGLTSATNYGQIALSGAASFTGSLSANIKDPLYSPTPGTTFNLLSYTSETGILFTSTMLPAHINWITNYGATIFSITVTGGTNPAPVKISFTTVNGTNLLVQWPSDHTGWRLQSQTNSPGVGLTTNWFNVPGSGLTNQVTFGINKTLGSVFFRMVYP
jgi:hypothetical protein